VLRNSVIGARLVNYPYVYSAGTLKRFLEMLPRTAAPSKVTQEYLQTAGFKSKNDRAIISVLKFIKLLDDGGAPTEDYKLLRDKSRFGAIIALHIRGTYNELFALYPDANSESNDRLRDFFAPKTNASPEVLGKVIATFKTLCDSGDFGAAPTVPPAGQPAEQVRVVSQTMQGSDSGVTVNLNIQLQLPPTENAEIYDKIFESLKKHLIDRKPSADA
jgi:hypothetical protein